MEIKEKFKNCIKILKIARKPDKDEFSSTAKICAIGVLIIGMIGFIFYIISVLIG